MVFVEKSAKSSVVDLLQTHDSAATKIPGTLHGNIEFFHENAETKVLAYYRWSDEGTPALVVANFSDIYLSGNSIPNFPAAGTWHEWMYNKILEVGEEGFKFYLPESSAQVFV